MLRTMCRHTVMLLYSDGRKKRLCVLKKDIKNENFEKFFEM